MSRQARPERGNCHDRLQAAGGSAAGRDGVRPSTQFAAEVWSSRLLVRHLGIGDASVARAWRKYRVQPWRRETFSTDPQLEAKVRDVVGLYLNPPTNAVVLCVDEKAQIQALNRTASILPLRQGLPERAPHDYKRNGTTTLFAALEVATGKVTDCGPPICAHDPSVGPPDPSPRRRILRPIVGPTPSSDAVRMPGTSKPPAAFPLAGGPSSHHRARPKGSETLTF